MRTNHYEICEVHPVNHPRRFRFLSTVSHWRAAVTLMRYYHSRGQRTVAFNIDVAIGRWDSHTIA